MRVIQTFRQSVEWLRKGEHLIIFAEQPSGWQSHETELNRGFLQIAPMAYCTLGLTLPFYPMHIDYKARRFSVGAPVRYDPATLLKEQEERLLAGIRAGI